MWCKIINKIKFKSFQGIFNFRKGCINCFIDFQVREEDRDDVVIQEGVKRLVVIFIYF